MHTANSDLFFFSLSPTPTVTPLPFLSWEKAVCLYMNVILINLVISDLLKKHPTTCVRGLINSEHEREQENKDRDGRRGWLPHNTKYFGLLRTKCLCRSLVYQPG